MRWARRAGWMLVLIGVALLVIWAARLAWVAYALREHLSQAQSLMDTPEGADLTQACLPSCRQACNLIEELGHDVRTVHREAGWLVQLAPLLGWLPKVGGDLRAAPHLLDVADGLAGVGAILCATFEPVWGTQGTGRASDLSLEQLADLLTEHRTDIEQAQATADRIQAAWTRVDTSRLSPYLAEKAALLEQGLPLLRAGLEVAPVAPQLLGFDGPRTYLILAQNEDELRPAGGFISGAGQITLERGQITRLSFLDANLVDNYEHKTYPDPPEPLFRYMGSEIWLFRDANWSPDFPTSARQAAYFYEYGQGVPVDGVVALDQRALELLLAGLGQVQVPGAAEPVTAANVRQFMREAWNPGEAGVTHEWVFSRKEFIGRLASAIRGRLEEDPESVDWAQLGRSLYQALSGRHLLLFLEDPQAAAALARVQWDGAVRESAGDYLMIVDANLGFSKANALMQERADYRVILQGNGSARAELSVTYAHQGRQQGVRCEQAFPYAGDLTYEAMMHRCYYDYLRVYVPAGSTLRTAMPHPTPGEYLLRGEPLDGRAVQLDEEAGKAVLAQFLVVEYGQTMTAHLQYDLPRLAQPGRGRRHYTLLIQKQAGTAEIPIALTVVLPPGAKLLAATSTPQNVAGETLSFDLKLDGDVTIDVLYR